MAIEKSWGSAWLDDESREKLFHVGSGMRTQASVWA